MFERTNASRKAAAGAAGDWSFSGTIVTSLFGAALLAGLVVVLSFWAFQQIEASVAARLHTYTLISKSNALLSDITDAETGQRGYSLTGDEAFLAPYLAGRSTIEPEREFLRPLKKATAARQHLDTLIPLVSAKLAELATVV